jgi:hypothetical protein
MRKKRFAPVAPAGGSAVSEAMWYAVVDERVAAILGSFSERLGKWMMTKSTRRNSKLMSNHHHRRVAGPGHTNSPPNTVTVSSSYENSSFIPLLVLTARGEMLVLVLLTAAFTGPTHALCHLKKDAVVAVYAATDAGGVGTNSAVWTKAFFTWFSAPNPTLIVDFIVDPLEISDYYTTGCQLATGFPDLALWVQPGGSADNYSTSLGPGGRDNILDFAASPNGHLMGTCAGFYYMSGSYWWFDSFFPEAWMPHLWPTVEGPIKQIAVYPDYAPVTLDDGRTVIYWGGPVLGLNHTTASVPNGAETRVSFKTPLLQTPLGAAYRYKGEYVDALFNSPHPEAVAGSGISCSPPLPAGCITPAQQLENWRWLAAEINLLLGTAYTVPTTL